MTLYDQGLFRDVRDGERKELIEIFPVGLR